jgi:molybdate transport system regulatory protein
MKMSARNRFAGTVTEVKTGAVMAQVTIDIGGGNHVTSAIFVESVNDLAIKKGDKVWAVIKSTDVIVIKD